MQTYIKLLVVSSFLSVVVSGNAYSANFNVSTADDFRTAIMTAQSNGEDDTVYLAAGAYYTGEAMFSYRPQEAYKLTISAASGLTASDVFLDGDNSTRVLYVYTEDYAAGIEIKNITVRNGLFEDGEGAGIYIETDGDALISGCIITENQTKSKAGGIFIRAVNAAISDTTISKNTCSSSSSQGGGLYTYAVTTLSSTTFSENDAADCCGAVRFNDDAVVTGSHFEKNSCRDSGCDGGAVYSSYGINIEGTSFSENSSKDRGGAGMLSGDMKITGCAFDSNTAESGGGGVWRW